MIQKPKLSFIQALRAWAIVLVFCNHFILGLVLHDDICFSTVTKKIFYVFLSSKVEITWFFIITGYLSVPSLLAIDTIRKYFIYLLKKYYRVLPLVLLVLVIPYSFFIQFNLQIIVDHILLLNIYKQRSAITGVVWTLIFQMYFYYSFGLLALISKRLITSNLFLVMLYIGLFFVIYFFFNSIYIHFLTFIIGVSVYINQPNFKKIVHLRKQAPQILLGISSILLIGLLVFWNFKAFIHDQKLGSMVSSVCLQVLYGCIFVGLQFSTNKVLDKIIDNEGVQFIGRISFSFFLIHVFFINQVNTYFDLYTNYSLPLALCCFIVSFTVSLALASVLEFYVERLYYRYSFSIK